jgi:hypothetical protein
MDWITLAQNRVHLPVFVNVDEKYDCDLPFGILIIYFAFLALFCASLLISIKYNYISIKYKA